MEIYCHIRGEFRCMQSLSQQRVLNPLDHHLNSPYSHCLPCPFAGAIPAIDSGSGFSCSTIKDEWLRSQFANQLGSLGDNFPQLHFWQIPKQSARLGKRAGTTVHSGRSMAMPQHCNAAACR